MKSYIYRLRVIEYVILPVSLIPYLFLSFLNVDPMHDGWFTTPAAALAGGAVPYRDVVTSYGWFTPAILSFVMKGAGFQLIALRLLGLFLLSTTVYLSYKVLSSHISEKAARYLVSAWLWLGLGQLLKDSSALPSSSMWPNQFLVISVLFFMLKIKRQISYALLITLGAICGLAPWVRAQGILIALSALLIAMVVLDRLKARLVFIAAFLISLLAPVSALKLFGAWDNFIWQTIEMPRTGEWFGMPNPVQWFALNFGIAVAISTIFYFFAAVLTKLIPLSRTFFIILVVLFVTISFVRTPKADLSQNPLLRKVCSLLYLYTNFNYFLVPVLFILMVIVIVSVALIYEFLRYRFSRVPILEFLNFMLPVSLVSLTYYNFGHLWGIGLVLLIAIIRILNFIPMAFNHLRKSFFVGKAYVISAVLVSIFLFGSLVFKPLTAYEDPKLRFMMGTNSGQVHEIDTALNIVRSIPKGEQVFFLCESALYATREGQYISDNIFYSSIMTYFDLRPSYDQAPKSTTKYVLYCPGTNPKNVSSLNGEWLKVSASSATVELYRRR